MWRSVCLRRRAFERRRSNRSPKSQELRGRLFTIASAEKTASTSLACVAQDIEHGRCSLAMGSVVERQRDAARVGQAQRDPERARERRDDCCGREQQRPHGVIVAGMQLALGFVAVAWAMIGYSLADSPTGSAAWLYDIFNGGTGNTGNPEKVLSRDDMLDEITLFWLTNTAASSARLYLEQAQLLAKRNNPGRVDLPVAVSVFPHDLPAARSWAPQVYPNLFYWHELERGGHFASLEVPELFTNELRQSFRSFRTTERR